MPPKKRARLITRKGFDAEGRANEKKEKSSVEVVPDQQKEFDESVPTTSVIDVEMIESKAALPETIIVDNNELILPNPVVEPGCRCFQARSAIDLCPLHEMDMIGDEPEPGFEDPTTILTPNIIRQFETSFSIEDDDDHEGPADNEFVEVETIPVINRNPQNEQDRQNDEVDRQETEADIERIRNRDAQIPTYLRATERNNVPIHSAGMMDQTCQHCDARFFLQEKTARNEYNKCCNNGKVELPPLGEHPPQLAQLFLGLHPHSGEFKKKILYYNNCFQFVSIQASLRNLPGYGPYVYSIYGKIYHHISNINVNRENYKYGPLYFLDPQQAVEQRLNNVNEPLNRELMMLITEELQTVNPFAQQYRHMHDVYEQEKLRMENENIEVPRVYLEFVGHHRDRNNREHDLPVVNEVAIVANYDENNPPNPRMHVFLTNQDDGTRTLEQTSEFADPLTFPLLFPNGDLGWNDNIPLVNRRERQQREKVTLCQFYAYRLSYRHNNNENFQIFEHGGKLMQQFIVQAYLKIEANRINFFLQNQHLLRAEEYYGLVDYLHNRAEIDNIPIGQRVILPSTFEMSPRNQMQRYQDAMAVCSEVGYPSLFITFTCNPKWPEILDNLPPGEEVTNHPMLICRVFKMKLDDLMIDLTKRYVLGVCIAHLQVIEFQKRGLPHAHILITLRNEDRPLDPIRIDQLICAEIPDPETEPDLHTLVGRHMIHGPCGQFNTTDVCMVDNKCTRNFPKYWYNNTTIKNGRISYRRRNNGRKIDMRRNNRHYSIDSRFVVPYNPYLLLKYRTHINIEACTSTGTVKYLYKYFFKGSDQALLRIVENRDNSENNLELRYNEIHSYLNGRYMTAPEACWRILKMPMHENSHTVIRLPIHLPGRQKVFFRRNDEEAVAQREAKTQLTEWFELNRTDPDARQYLYREIPLHYVWDKSKKQWKKRQRFFEKTVSRMYNISVRNGELYYLRVLLLRIRGATSFESLKTINGVICETFQEACSELNLLAEDREWVRCLTEASERAMPKQIRQMFAYILVFCTVNNPIQLWNEFKNYMMEDFTRQRMNEHEAEIKTLQKIQFILMVNGRRLSEFGLQDPPEYRPNLIENPINVVEEQQIANNLIEKLNDNQETVFNIVKKAIENDDEARRYFFISGAAGTGKTFLYNTIITFMHAQEHKVISVAWTGIAAALLKQGRTVHSQFRLPVPILENSTSSISAQSDIAKFIRETKLIIWDEVTMATRTAFELVDRTLKDICGNQRLFGGKCVILGGDFKQCLPVVPDGDRFTIVNQCIKSSYHWNFFENIQLKINMRLRENEQDFLNWLNLLGHGQLPNVNLNNNNVVQQRQHNLIEIPQKCIVNSLNELIDKVFEKQFEGNDIPINKAILTPLNAQCHQINSMILKRINGETKSYLSIDSVITDDEAEAANYPQEFLNSLTPPGFAQHELTLKQGSIVMLLRNLNIRANLCNGTRLVIRHLGEHHIQAEIIDFNGKLSGNIVFLPKIDFVSANSPLLPFVMRRRQFPLRLSYCMTINKAQGQTFDSLGIYLPKPVFTHGQLYVAFSRARAIDNVRVCLENTPRQGILTTNDNQLLAYTPNIVFTEIL